MAVAEKLKTTLDESRLLILGVQVLFGFQFEAVFQELFADVPATSRYVHCAGLILLLISLGLLMAPSLFHQILYGGNSTPEAVQMAAALAGASLLPLTLGLGAAIFVTFEHLFSRSVGIIAGVSLAALALLLLYGLGLTMRKDHEEPPRDRAADFSLKARIDQMLTEARVIIPGAQALLGFQLIAVLTRAFSELPEAFKYIHCAALSAVTLSIILLMTPAALHRIGFHGEDDPVFFKLGSRFVVAGSIPLAVGIAGDVAVVFFKAVQSEEAALLSGLISLVALLGFWLGYPFCLRIVSQGRPSSES